MAKELGVTDQDRLFSASANMLNLATGGSPVDVNVDLVKLGDRLRGWLFRG